MRFKPPIVVRYEMQTTYCGTLSRLDGPCEALCDTLRLGHPMALPGGRSRLGRVPGSPAEAPDPTPSLITARLRAAFGIAGILKERRPVARCGRDTRCL